MASLFKAISNVVRGAKDDLAKTMADPVRDGKIAIADSEKQVGEFTSKIAQLVAENKRLIKQRDESIEESEKFGRIAQKAAQAGNEADVRSSLEMKTRADERVVALTAESEKSEQLTTMLRDQLGKARAKVAQAKSNMTRMSARVEGAKIRTELAKASSEFNAGKSPLGALDDLEKAVENQESEAEAWEEMVGMENEGSAADLASKYDTPGSALDDEVAKLMAASKGN